MTNNVLTKRKPSEVKQNQSKAEESSKSTKTTTKSKFQEPLPKIPYHKIWTRCTVILGLLIYVWYSSKGSETVLAKQKDLVTKRGQHFECHPSYLKEIEKYTGCIPKKCGRFVMDKLVTATEAQVLVDVAKKGMALTDATGSASILDLHTGALTHGTRFINAYSLNEKFLTQSDLMVYQKVRQTIQQAIAENFNIDARQLHLTKPTFFSKLTSYPAKTVHDEYWHIHVDKETYETFHYTSLLYLTDYGVDFQGGRFVFVDDKKTNVTVEPRKGRVLMFTSGAENRHFVEKVIDGSRFAITVSFTCDQTAAIQDPFLH